MPRYDFGELPGFTPDVAPPIFPLGEAPGLALVGEILVAGLTVCCGAGV